MHARAAFLMMGCLGLAFCGGTTTEGKDASTDGSGGGGDGGGACGSTVCGPGWS